MRSISSQAGLQLLNVLVTLTLSHRLPRACTWVYKQANFSQKACHLGSCIAYSSSSLVFTSPPPAALVLALLRRSCFPGGPMISRPLLFLYRLARVHQEDRSYLFLLEVPCPVDRCCSCTTLLVSTKRTTALPWWGTAP